MMDLEDIDNKIEAFRTQLHAVEKAEKHISNVESLLEKLHDDLKLNKAKMDKEYIDVLSLETLSTRKLFATILGNFESQLERERQEYLQAALEYNGIVHEINLLEYELTILKKKVINTDDLKKQLDYYLKIKEQKILYHNGEHAPKIKLLNQEIDRLRSYLREIKEAKNIAIILDKKIRSSFLKLSNILNYEYFQFQGAGKYSSYAKKKYIDEALKEAVEINNLINKLDKELSDVYSQYVFFSIYKYQNFIDSFYDNLITDWILQTKLKNAQNCLESAINQIHRILATLNQDEKKSHEKIDSLISEKRMYVSNA